MARAVTDPEWPRSVRLGSMSGCEPDLVELCWCYFYLPFAKRQVSAPAEGELSRIESPDLDGTVVAPGSERHVGAVESETSNCIQVTVRTFQHDRDSPGQKAKRTSSATSSTSTSSALPFRPRSPPFCPRQISSPPHPRHPTIPTSSIRSQRSKAAKNARPPSPLVLPQLSTATSTLPRIPVERQRSTAPRHPPSQSK